ncbi:MAG: hypothetical protein ACTHLE_15405 [Agriterribacter sp.]
MAPTNTMWVADGKGFLPKGKLMVDNGEWLSCLNNIVSMKLIGFKNQYDTIFTNSLPQSCKNFIEIDKKEVDTIVYYLDNSTLILSKTWGLFDDDRYIGPYMLLSDGEWLWPSYYSFFVKKTELLKTAF